MFNIKFTRTSSGYMGQIEEWPEVISEGATLEECRSMIEDALREMIEAYRTLSQPIPFNRES